MELAEVAALNRKVVVEGVAERGAVPNAVNFAPGELVEGKNGIERRRNGMDEPGGESRAKRVDRAGNDTYLMWL